MLTRASSRWTPLSSVDGILPKERELRLFFETLENKPQLIDTWDENLWITLVEKMEVSHDKECEVFFKNGVSVKVNI